MFGTSGVFQRSFLLLLCLLVPGFFVEVWAQSREPESAVPSGNSQTAVSNNKPPAQTTAYKPGDYFGSMNHSSGKRSFYVYLPKAYNHVRRLPLVLVLHGGAGDGPSVAVQSGFSNAAEEHDFIAVYPEGTEIIPKSGMCAWYVEFGFGNSVVENKPDDVDFFRCLIENLQATLKIDPARVYVCGISNGGMMSHRLGAYLPRYFAAIASVVGPAFGRLSDKSTDRENVLPNVTVPVPVLMISGLIDTTAPVFGGKFSSDMTFTKNVETVFSPVLKGCAYWINQNKCHSVPDMVKVNDKKTVIRQAFLQKETGQALVRLVLITNQGHCWPGGHKANLEGDEPAKDLNATQEIWEMFSEFSRENPPVPAKPQVLVLKKSEQSTLNGGQ